jgi:hypothetical protein
VNFWMPGPIIGIATRIVTIHNATVRARFMLTSSHWSG